MSRPAWRHLALAACAALVAPLTSSPSPVVAATRYLDAMFAVDVERDVVYGTAVNIDGSTITLTLDLYTPRGDVATNRPVFVYAHGGYFFVGDKSTTTLWATRMAQRGYVAASINYRLGREAVLAPVDTPLERQVIDNARADMQTSVRWFRANAVSLRIDPDRIAVGGSSAGAVTALGVAVNSDDPLPGDYADLSSAVCTAVSISGANDPTAVSVGDAGAIFHHGAIDTVVPYGQAVQTRDAMVANGLAVQWNEYPDEGHSLTTSTLSAIVQPTIQWLYDKVATAPFPCSPAVALEPPVPAGRQTVLAGLANMSGIVSLVSVGNVVPGFVQALPCGSTPGESSNLNTDAPKQIRSVLAVVSFDPQARACLFNQSKTHLVADLQGWFAPLSFDDVADDRLLDTRRGAKPGDASQTIITGRPNSTAVVSLVVTETTGAGYVQVLPCGAEPGGSSNLNADAGGQIRAGLAFVRFDGQGQACLFTQRAAHMVVDLQGYMADASIDDIVDVRLLDTRLSGPPPGGSITEIVGRPNATGVVSLVATETTGPGYLQVLPCSSAPGGYSNLNTDSSGQILAGLAFVRFDGQGRACVFNQTATHLVVDVQGYLANGAFVDLPDERLLDTRTR